jgi:hypothetical protein
VPAAAVSDNLTTLFRFLLLDTTLDTMTNDRKRTALAASAGSNANTPSKKRKMDGVQKFYAVKTGKTPGVYMTYAECQQHTSGYRGAVCKFPGPG